MFKDAVLGALGNPGTPDHAYKVSGTSKFQTLDADKIRKELGIDAAAVLRGRQNLPRPDDTEPDDSQRAIVNEIETYWHAAASGYEGEMKTYESRLATVSVHSTSSEIIQAAKNAEGDYLKLIQQAELDLNQIRDQRNNAAKDLLSFREENRLRRDAKLDRWHPFVSYALLVLILVVETVFNGTFFAERVSGGWIQGIGEAFLFAIINILGGYFAGRIFTGLSHIRLKINLLAAIALLILFAAIFLNNLFAAHYRFVLTDDVDVFEAAGLAWRSLSAHPLGVEDIKSWQLFALGIACALVSAWKAWKLDDPYPGYGDLARLHEKRIQQFIDAKNYHLEEVDSAHAKASDKISANLKALDGSIAQYRALLEYRRRFHQSYSDYVTHLESVANDLLTAYRQKNREVRTDGAGPEYFKQQFKFPRAIPPEPGMQEEEVKAAARLVSSTRKTLEEQLDVLHEARKRAMEDMKAIS